MKIPFAERARLLRLGLLAGLLALASCRGGLTIIEYGVPIPTAKIVGSVAGKGRFSTILALLNRPDFGDLLNRLNDTVWFAAPETFTAFLPNDDAFNALSADERKRLLADTSKLRAMLYYHFVAKPYTTDKLAKLSQLPSISDNQPLYISVQADGKLMVNDAHLLETDIFAINGVVHEIDKLLMPGSFSPSPAASPTPAASPIPTAPPLRLRSGGGDLGDGD